MHACVHAGVTRPPLTNFQQHGLRAMPASTPAGATATQHRSIGQTHGGRLTHCRRVQRIGRIAASLPGTACSTPCRCCAAGALRLCRGWWRRAQRVLVRELEAAQRHPHLRLPRTRPRLCRQAQGAACSSHEHQQRRQGWDRQRSGSTATLRLAVIGRRGQPPPLHHQACTAVPHLS